jgi:hypothetical protein
MTAFIYAVKTTVVYNGKIIDEILSNLVSEDFVDCRDDEFWKDNACDILFQGQELEDCDDLEVNPDECEYLVSYGRFVADPEEVWTAPYLQ